MNSCRKGKVGERELAAELRKLGFGARRGQQHTGLEGEDVVGVPGIHVECKRTERLLLEAAVEQAANDADPSTVPAVFSRRNRGEWLVTFRLCDWWRLALALSALREDRREGRL